MIGIYRWKKYGNFIVTNEYGYDAALHYTWSSTKLLQGIGSNQKG